MTLSRPTLALAGALLLAGCNHALGRAVYEAGRPDRAVRIWASAAALGDDEAKLALARLYTRAEAVPRDLDRAAALARSAAGSTTCSTGAGSSS